MLRALIVGCGKIAGAGAGEPGHTHAGVLQQLPDVEIAGCVDSNPSRTQLFAEKYACPVATDLQSGLSSFKPDIVSICTPDETHFELVRQCLVEADRPRLVFVEKPVCKTPGEFEALIQLAEANFVPVIVNHSRRFDTWHGLLRTRILAGEFGALRDVYATYYGGWRHNGVHLVDTLQFLVDQEIRIDNVGAIESSKYENDPTIEFRGGFAESVVRMQIFGQQESDYQLFEMEFRFEHARLRIEDFGNRVVLERKYVNELEENVLSMASNGLPERTVTPMQSAYELICTSLIESRPELLTGYRIQDIQKTMNTIWRGLRACEQS